MERRGFLSTFAAAAAGRVVLPGCAARAAGESRSAAGEGAAHAAIQTVGGSVAPEKLGTTLVHEHVLVDFSGASVAGRSRYDADDVFGTVLPHLKALAARGCRTLVECTPAYLGRDPGLLRRLSNASGLQILTNTGYYGAAKDIAIPAHAYAESARQLADRWTAEFRDGIDGSGIHPAFVKSGVDAGALSEIDRKLVEAAALCHLDTGLTLAIHTGDAEAAGGIVRVLLAAGVSPEAWIWVHAQNGDRSAQLRAADAGAWLELDGVSPQSLDAHVAAVADLRRRGRLGRVLVSQDAGWYHVGEAGGGDYRPHTFLFDRFVPALRVAGLSAAEVRRLLVDNPARAFTPRLRRARA